MFCKNCGKEIDDKAVVCPECGISTKNKKKKSIFKRWWFWVLVGVLAICIIGGSSGEDKSSDDTDTNLSATQDVGDASADKEAENKNDATYEVVDLQTMLDELNANALKAEKTYQDKLVEVTGQITNFDSDGAYINIEPVNADEWNFDNVMCMIENDTQLNYLLEKSVGDTVTVKGQIISIGEVLGYTIEMTEVH